MRGLIWGAVAVMLVACGSDPLAGGGAAGEGGSGAGGASGDAAVGGSGGGSAGATTGGTGGSATGGSATGGSATGGAAGSDLLFSDDFDTERTEWQFDDGDPEATYVYQDGELVVTGGSAQAFVWLPVPEEWGSDYQVDVSFRIESGMVGGAVVRAQDTDLVNAYNCNLREDLDQLRAARHNTRNYFTIGAQDTAVDLKTTYSISGRVTGDKLHCSQAGGPSFDVTNIPRDTKAVGLFVYRGTVVFESFSVRR